MTAGGVIVEPGAPPTTAEPPQQVSCHATFVEKPILAHVAQRLPLPPLSPSAGHIGSPLFIGVERFF